MSLKRYEYKIIDPALWRGGEAGAASVGQIEAELNRLGREGWEIVGVVGGDVTSEHGPLCLAKRKVKTHHRKHDEKSD